MEKEQKLIELLAEVFNMDAEQLTLETTRDEVEEWDSLAMVQIVAEIETIFECEIPFDEVEKCTIIKDFLKYIG